MNAANPVGDSPRISNRLIIASAVSLGTALLLAIGLLIAAQYVTLRASVLEDAQIKLAVVADNVSAALVFGDEVTATDILQSLKVSPDVEMAFVLDVRRNVLAIYPPDLPKMPAGFLEPGRTTHRFAGNRLEIIAPVRHQNQEVGWLCMRVSLRAMYHQLGRFSLVSLGTALIAMLVALGLLMRAHQSVHHAEQKLSHMALVDPVTGLANRYALNERLEFAIREADQFSETLAILLLDLDNFKQVNDTLGHQAGDELLRMVAQRIANTLRRDDAVARLGGDEFAFILRNISGRSEVMQICTKLVENIAQPIAIDGHDFFVTASIGVALYPDDGEDSKTLTRNADTAMYQAKLAGKNAYEFFTASMNASVKKRVSMETCLRNALQNEELTLHYQPKIDLSSGRLDGFEALLRWHNLQLGGTVSPADFIPVAEDSGLIVPIGEWVIRKALSDLRFWNVGRSRKLHMAVNLSARQLKVEDIDSRIIRLVNEIMVPPEWLEIELTESMVMGNVHTHVEIFQRLKDHGVSLAIDDFGTGYSSMAYLKRLPINTLKIDRSFVGDLTKNQNDLAIATAIIALGHSLDLRVVAEGVETEAQLEVLRQLGCDIGQGYYFARPMPAEQVVGYLETMI